MDEVVIDGMTYVPKETKGDSGYSIVRCDRSGVFAAQVSAVSEDGKKATLNDCRRIWYWSGASSISELALKGTSRPGQCKFPAAVSEQVVTDILEIIPMTKAAMKSVYGVKIWSQH